MTEPQIDPGLDDLDPGESFNEGIEAGYDIGSQESLEEIEEQLINAGFDPDEIEEALYDPAPRRGRRRHGGRKGRRSARRTYDPAPGRRRKYRAASAYPKKGKKGKRGKFAKFRKFVLPATTIGSFYLSYSANAKARNMTVLDALKYDLGNWSAQKTIDKISANPLPIVGTIGIPVAKQFIPGARSGMVGMIVDAVQGIMTGQFLTQVVDEPVASQHGNVQVIPVVVSPCNAGVPAVISESFRNPYA